MAQGTYDIITVGGGLGGSSLAKVMAEHGARVLVVERETQFQDRIRGEILNCWGVAETQALGLYALLRDTCAHESPRFGTYLGPEWDEPRNLVATTPQRLPAFNFYHPTMQEVVLQAALDAGAEVRRGATVRNVKRGRLPSVEVEQRGHVQELQARLIVGADGRGSVVRKWGGFPSSQDPDHLMVSGVLFDEMPVAEDTSYYVISPNLGQGSRYFPKAVAASGLTWCKPRLLALASKDSRRYQALSRNPSEAGRPPSGMPRQRQLAHWQHSTGQTIGWSIRTKRESC
jgi:flavin-dependent dehydrogenase